MVSQPDTNSQAATAFASARLLPHHPAMIAASAIAADVAGERGYRSVDRIEAAAIVSPAMGDSHLLFGRAAGRDLLVSRLLTEAEAAR